MWALGCLAFELYVGYPPFYNSDEQKTINNIINTTYPLHKI